jgi:hypothetical protein
LSSFNDFPTKTYDGALPTSFVPPIWKTFSTGVNEAIPNNFHFIYEKLNKINPDNKSDR